MSSASIVGELGSACRRYSDRIAIRSAREELTYAEFDLAIRHAAEAIGGTGEPACFFATANSSRALIALYGALAAGVVPFLADPLWPTEVRERIATFYGLRLAAGDPKYGWPVTEPAQPFGISTISGVSGERPRLRPATRFSRFTTGSTGHPRALEFTDAAALAAALGWARAANLTGDSRVLILASIHNGLSFNTSLLSVFLTGGTLLLHEGELFPSAIARSIERLGATELVAFPFVFDLLMTQGARYAPAFRRLRRAVSSAAKLSDQVGARWHELTGTAVANYYGIAEAGPVTFNDGSPDSVGWPIRGNEIVIGDEDVDAEHPREGRILVRTPSMASGYVPDGRAPMNLAPDGFLRTSDRGYLRGDGALVLTGRLGDVVNIAGMKVDPEEIEASVRELDGVLDVVVRAEESTTRLFLAAYVESDVLTPAAVRDYCVRRFVGHKIPQKIRVLAKLPRSASGKVISSALS